LTGNVDVPPHLLASELLEEFKDCSFCGQRIQKGRTNKGKLSWFDKDGTNHWATCPERKQAREHFGPRR